MSSAKKLTSINFFISSTFIDLEDYRKTIIDKIQSLQGVINAQEFFGARPNTPLETMIDELKKSNVIILVIAHRYGSIDEKTQKSYTQIEYETAIDEKKIIFPYIIDETHPFNPKYIDDNEDKIKLNEFKKLVINAYQISTFTTKEDLAMKVIQDLERELPKHDIIIGAQKLESQNITFIKQMCQLPKLMNGREITLNIKLNENWESASDKANEALDLTEGASIQRKFKVLDEDYTKIIEDKFPYIYASNEKALELSELDSDTYTIVLRLKFGHVKSTISERKIVADNDYNPLYNTLPYLALTEMMKPKEKVVMVDKNVYNPFSGLIFVEIKNLSIS